ncbi:hypothetical protein QJS10_CPB12g01224 [Acorus calamus]|uniref:Uncharacterized protein n=1 Tax=Acorus calamus TaxID=4465 RepID=A0AAV9DL85_ACOCL|nr:hypothetical protein QJS10_CPB12g01224 [Acorus calamus]
MTTRPSGVATQRIKNAKQEADNTPALIKVAKVPVNNQGTRSSKEIQTKGGTSERRECQLTSPIVQPLGLIQPHLPHQQMIVGEKQDKKISHDKLTQPMPLALVENAVDRATKKRGLEPSANASNKAVIPVHQTSPDKMARALVLFNQSWAALEEEESSKKELASDISNKMKLDVPNIPDAIIAKDRQEHGKLWTELLQRWNGLICSLQLCSHQRLIKLQKPLRRWNNTELRDLPNRFKEAQKHLETLLLEEQRRPPTKNNMNQVRMASNYVAALQTQLETFWSKRARSKWVKEGDSNTRFFHSSVQHRRVRNRITSLRTEEGEILSDMAQIREYTMQHFSEHYGKINYS